MLHRAGAGAGGDGFTASGGSILAKKKMVMAARVYLDWNATTPLRPEARAAMLAAMDVAGNPSSVHAEGRAARAVVERARAQVAAALGAGASDIVFTGSASEAAALALAGRGLAGAAIEHEAVAAWTGEALAVDGAGRVQIAAPERATLQLANSETGVVQDLPQALAVSDLTQGFGKLAFGFDWSGVQMGLISAHKLGGPKGVGALALRRGLDIEAQVRGGGQEMGRRSGTENVIGIAGFGAAAEAAARDLADGIWEPVADLRDAMEAAIEAEMGAAVVFSGRGARRLPNTSCFALSGWKGETQVMAMDLAGFAISAGSACSSGKLRASGVLTAMGFDAGVATSAIRVSLGPDACEGDVMRFVEAWTAQAKKFQARVA